MRPTSGLAAAIALVAFTACGPSLGHAPEDRFQIEAAGTARGGLTGFKILYRYDTSAGCFSLSGGARATVNGVVQPVLHRGGFLPGNPFTGGTGFCVFPAMFVSVEALTPESTFTFEDGGAVVSATVADLGATLALEVTPPADGHIRAGSTVGLSWTPAGDDVHLLWGYLQSQVAPQPSLSFDLTDFQGGRGEIVVPSSFQPGRATLLIGGERRPAVTRCEGVERCDFRYNVGFQRVEVEVQVEP